MSNHEVYLSVDTSTNADKHNRKSAFEQAKEHLYTIYKAIVNKEQSIILNLRVFRSFSEKQSRDLKEALKGDYIEKYHVTQTGIFSLPKYEAFQERIEKSTFDNMNLETEALKFRFLAPFIIKAELSPGLAFSELLLSLIYVINFVSIFMNGESTLVNTLTGTSTLFLLLSIVHFWYGISRYPSIWNSFVPIVLKGSSLDRNFAEIREICGHCHNGNNGTNSQLIPFLITLPFTFLFHAVSFLVTAGYHLLKIPRNEGQPKYSNPIVASIFLSNALITCIWIVGGKPGIIFATLSVIFNQKAYNSLLFKKDLKDFCLSLLFGNLLVVKKEPKTNATEIKFTEYKLEYDLEEGIQQYSKESHASEVEESSPRTTPTPVRSLHPLLGASTSSSVNTMVESGKVRSFDFSTEAQKNYLSVINGKVFSLHSGDGRVDRGKNESPPEIFIDETNSQQSQEDALNHPQMMKSISHYNRKNDTLDYDARGMKQNNFGGGIKTQEMKHSTKSSKNKFFGFSRRLFSSPRNRKSQEKKLDDQLSVEFLNPSDVHLDIETHPGTIEWQNTISESIQRFKIRSYTLRKHNWVMKQMHGKSFFIQQQRARRRKLKRKEIKEHCKAFHDKKIDFNSQLFGILDDLKDLKKNHNNSRSNSDHTRRSGSNVSSQLNKKAGMIPDTSPKAEESKVSKEIYTMNDQNNQAFKGDAASSTKESLVDSSKESTISTLTQSFILESVGDARDDLWDDEAKDDFKEQDDSSSALKKAISGLLECTPWIDNINMLKETGSIEESFEVQHVWLDRQNLSSKKNNQPKNGNGQIYTGGGDDRNRSSNMQGKHRPYWQNFVDKEETYEQELGEESREYISGEFVPASDPSSKKRRRSHPWRSDLQKKKLEKVRENRSKSKKVALKQTKRIMSIWKKKKANSGPYDVFVEVNSTRKPRERENSKEFCADDRHDVVVKHGNHFENRRDDDCQPSDENNDRPYARTDLRQLRNDDWEMLHTIENTLCDKISYGKECGAFEGMTSACSLPIEQREDDEQDYLFDYKLMSSNRFIY